FCPHHFLSTEWLLKPLTGWALPRARPMDNVSVGWDSPQEDEMALCLLTMMSPYVMALRPDHLPTYGRFFNPDNMTPAERDEYQSAMRYYFRKLAVRDPRPLCLKSPGNTFRMRMLSELFPNARYVYIYRDPLAVIRSSIHLRRTMNDENSLGDRDQPNVESEILDVYEDSFRCYERDRGLISADRIYEMRYETLDSDPLSELDRMYSALNLEGYDALAGRLRPQLAEVNAFQKNRYDKDPDQAQRVYARLKFAYDRFGYDPPVTPTLQVVGD
ncbi:MAG: sulfotransferase family protein, partial [Planctomycetaceae bacterium]